MLSEEQTNTALPAEAQRWQQKDHEDEKRVAFVHGGAVFSRPKTHKSTGEHLAFIVLFFKILGIKFLT